MIQTNLPWEVQVGQVKLHVDGDKVETDEIYQLFPLLDHYSNQKGMAEWDFLDYVKLLDENDDRIGPLSKKLMEELQECVEAQVNGDEYTPTMFSLNSRIRSNMPDVLNEADNVHLTCAGHKVPWEDGTYAKSGVDVRVSDVINANAENKGFTIENFRINFSNMNFDQSSKVHQLVDIMFLEVEEPLVCGQIFSKLNFPSNICHDFGEFLSGTIYGIYNFSFSP